MKSKMTSYLSDKMKVLSLIAITMVIYIHTYYTEGENYPMFQTLQRFIGGEGISGIANPLFYFISGYLFFMGMTKVQECFPKMKKRIRTLLIPYLLANTIAFAMYAVLDGITRLLPSLYNVVNFHILDWFSLDVSTILYKVYWEPVAFQLWFVRDMIQFVIISPLIYILLRFLTSRGWLSISSLIAILLLYFCYPHHVIWMAIGGLVALSNVVDLTDFSFNKYKEIGMYVCLALFIAISWCVSSQVCEIPFEGYTLLGVIGVWLLYDKIVAGRLLLPKSQWLSTSCGLTFFIYLIHEPTLLIFKKLPLLISSNELMLTLCFMLIPIIFIACTIIIGMLLRKWMLLAFGIYTGGR